MIAGVDGGSVLSRLPKRNALSLTEPMPADSKDHCPIDEDELSVERQAWRGGWEYRMENGPGKPSRGTVLNVMGKPSLISTWMEGYSAADAHQRTD